MSETDTTTGTGKSRVRVARERKGLTQAELAELVGCHIETVKAWDQGKRKPGTPELAQQLADVLARPLEWLFPPEEHAYVRDARARHPTTATEIPDPRDVLATLKPGRPALPVRLAAALALLATTATIAMIAIAIAALSGSRHDATPGPTPTLTPAVDAIDAPAGAERAAISQAEPAATGQAEPKTISGHVRRPIKRSQRRAATHHRHRARHRRHARRRSTQPTYPASAATARVSQPASPTTPDGTRTQPVAATNTTAANAATATVQQSASSSANQAAVAPDGPSEFDGP